MNQQATIRIFNPGTANNSFTSLDIQLRRFIATVSPESSELMSLAQIQENLLAPNSSANAHILLMDSVFGRHHACRSHIKSFSRPLVFNTTKFKNLKEAILVQDSDTKPPEVPSAHSHTEATGTQGPSF